MSLCLFEHELAGVVGTPNVQLFIFLLLYRIKLKKKQQSLNMYNFITTLPGCSSGGYTASKCLLATRLVI